MPYVMDTNIVSEAANPRINEKVLDWFWYNTGELYLTTVSIMELNYGVMLLPDGKRKRALRASIDAITKDCRDHILDFDGFSAYLCADLRVKARAAGRTPQIADLMIAAICLRNDLPLATHNVKDFDYLGLEYVDPFEFESPVLKRLMREEEERRLREGRDDG